MSGRIKEKAKLSASVEGRKLLGAEITLYTVLRTAYTASQRVIKFSEEHIRDYNPLNMNMNIQIPKK